MGIAKTQFPFFRFFSNPLENIGVAFVWTTKDPLRANSCVMSSYFDEHDCTPLAEGTAPDELLQFARFVRREDSKRVGGNGEKGNPVRKK